MEHRQPTQNIDDAGQIQQMLEALQQSDGVNLYLDDFNNGPWQVRILAVQPGQALRLELDRPSESKPVLAAGIPFRLVGEAGGAMVRTAPLTLTDQDTTVGRGQCLCTYPDALEAAFRRSTFRAALTPDMPVLIEFTLSQRGTSVRGMLKNLSLGGCLVEVPMADGVRLAQQEAGVALTAHFPSGEKLEVVARILHIRPDQSWNAALAGCQFAPASPSLERRLWYLAQEVERHNAYEQATSTRVKPSALFQATPAFMQRAAADAQEQSSNATSLRYVLQGVATSLNAQLLQIHAGAVIATKPLLRQSAVLIEQLRQNRDALLYEICCLDEQPVLVRHGLAVAARLAHMAISNRVEIKRLAAIVACALIHDFGKALLPAALTKSRMPLSEQQRSILATHVQSLIDRLDDSTVLPIDIVTAVIAQANERLDGSGYPNALAQHDLPQLARMMAVVDAADAMRRDRADRNAWPQHEVHEHLLRTSKQFDGDWVRSYIKHFGLMPVGSLVEYPSGKLAWVQRLDAQGNPAQVEVVMDRTKHHQRMPHPRIVNGSDLQWLGRPESTVDPREYGLERG